MAFSIGGALNNVIPAAQKSYANMQALNDQSQQAQAKAQLVKLFAQLAQNGQGQQQPQTTQAPILPTAASPSGGVSPSGGASVPAGGMPGGAGSPSPTGGMPSSPAGITSLPALAQAIQALGLSGGAGGSLLQEAARLQQPQNANAIKLDLGQPLANLRNAQATGANMQNDYITQNGTKIPSARAPSKGAASGDSGGLSNKDLMRLMDEQVRIMKSSYTDPSAVAAAQQRYNDLYTEMNSRRKKAGLPSKAPTAPAAPAAAPPQDTGTVQVISPDGTPGTIPAAQLQDAIAQGYKRQ